MADFFSIDPSPPTHPSIERLFRQYFGEAVHPERARVPVYRSLLADGILYRCPLRYHFPPTRWPEILARLPFPLAPLSLTADGWLEWSLDDRELSHWLERLQDSLDRFFPEPAPREPNGEFVFLFHYTHARCNALLRLADTLPPLSPPLSSPSYHPLERALFLQLLAGIDRSERGNPRPRLVSFCEAILDLDRGCRIVGESPAVARSRLRLISVSQRLLRFFLAAELGIGPMARL